MQTMCFLNIQTFRHNWRINIRLNGQTFRFKERTMFCYDLSQRAVDNILPQRANVLLQCLYDFYEYILPAKKLIAFRCSAFLFETGILFNLFCILFIWQSPPIGSRGLWRPWVIELPPWLLQALISARGEPACRLRRCRFTVVFKLKLVCFKMYSCSINWVKSK